MQSCGVQQVLIGPRASLKIQAPVRIEVIADKEVFAMLLLG